MDFNGTHRFAAPPQAVRPALSAPALLADRLPGARIVERVSESEFTFEIKRSKMRVAMRLSLKADGRGTMVQYAARSFYESSAADNEATRKFIAAYFKKLAAILNAEQDLTPQIWIAGVIAVVIVLLAVFSVVL